uniref:Putative secreted protein n=1 Tax=Anopheles darlingi TaxID=43151 RepID=A0A2M4DDN1_ANODA
MRSLILLLVFFSTQLLIVFAAASFCAKLSSWTSDWKLPVATSWKDRFTLYPFFTYNVFATAMDVSFANCLMSRPYQSATCSLRSAFP